MSNLSTIALRTHSSEYLSAIQILNNIKLIDGPIGLSSTLRNHKLLVEWLKAQCKNDLADIESMLDLYDKK